MRLFTPGPVPVEKHLLAIGERQPPYNRTEEFSQFTYELLGGLNYVFQTSGSVVLLTGSGTAAMEASVLCFLGAADNVLIINGGTFGQRWCDLCDVHTIAYDEYAVPAGEDIDLVQLEGLLCDHRYTALLVNAHETSSGHLYDIKAIGQITRAHGVFFMVDAISTICADSFFMDDWHVDVAILSSQKALALPPGLSFVAMNPKAKARLTGRKPVSMYFDLKAYLSNQRRGQLPFTPAISLMLQLHQRLLDIRSQTLSALVRTHRKRAESFRLSIEGLPLSLFPARSSNAMTTLVCHGPNAFETVEALRARFNIVVAPTNEKLGLNAFRISHMGAQEDGDITSLIEALKCILASKQPPNILERIES